MLLCIVIIIGNVSIAYAADKTQEYNTSAKNSASSSGCSITIRVSSKVTLKLSSILGRLKKVTFLGESVSTTWPEYGYKLSLQKNQHKITLSANSNSGITGISLLSGGISGNVSNDSYTFSCNTPVWRNYQTEITGKSLSNVREKHVVSYCLSKGGKI